MRKSFAILLCLLAFAISCALASAQTSSSLVLDAASLTPVNVDAVTGLALDPIVKDRSNRPCARIKLHINRMTPEEISEVEVRTIGGNVVVMKQQMAIEGNGLIIELTAKPETKFYLHHGKLGDSNLVNIALEGNKEYRMEAWSEQKLPITVFCSKPGSSVYLDGNYRGQIANDNHLTIPEVSAGRHKLEVKSGSDQHIQNIEVSSEKVFFNAELRDASRLQGFVVFKVTPADALVEFDGEHLFLNAEGRTQKLVRYGTYTYTVSAKDHDTVTGEVMVDSGQTVCEVALKMSLGWINIDGNDAEGAYVYIDSELAGQAPLKNFSLSRGTHHVKVIKPMCEPYETSVQVREGETVQVTPVFKSDAAEITLVADAGAEIWVNGELKGTGSWKGPMSVGDYLVECKKKGYASSTDAVTISRDMTTRIIRLTSLERSRGILVISSTPMEADVYIDGVHSGKTPQYMTDVPVGLREVKVVLQGYETWKENVQVLENHAHEMDIELKLLKGSALRKAKQEQKQMVSQPQEQPEPQRDIHEEPLREEIPEVELLTLKPGEISANSYIISEVGEYDIPAVRGNTSQSVGRVASAEVLWESFGTSVAPSIGDLVRDVTYSDGRIYFKTADKFREGNAVIAALDASGTILWSWHIWLTDQPAEQAYADAGIMMDRNLGATSAAPGNVGALGLLYQWGRKDPFLGSSSIEIEQPAASTITWPSGVESDYTTGAIGYSLSHPTTFIIRNEVNGDWHFTGTSSTDDSRWKSEKTIYDPCPAGWRVADGGKDGIWANAGFTDTTYDYDHWGMSQQVSPATSAWYPATGYRSDVNADLYSVSRYGYYWSATTSDYNAHSLYFSGNGSVNTADYYNRAYAFAVRCVKQ